MTLNTWSPHTSITLCITQPSNYRCTLIANLHLPFVPPSPAPSRPLPSAERGRYVNRTCYNQTDSCCPSQLLHLKHVERGSARELRLRCSAQLNMGSVALCPDTFNFMITRTTLDCRARHVNLSGKIVCTEHSISDNRTVVNPSACLLTPQELHWRLMRRQPHRHSKN
jgi:hypothetical protein